jgi:hypothetical protein
MDVDGVLGRRFGGVFDRVLWCCSSWWSMISVNVVPTCNRLRLGMAKSALNPGMFSTMRARGPLGRSVVLVLVACWLAIAGSVPGHPAPAAAPASPAAGYGFGSGSWMLWLNPADLNRELDAVAATNASWLRVLIDWNIAEPVQGQYDWAVFDRIIDAAGARGLQVLGVIAFSPVWARPPGSYFTAPPTDTGAFANFAKAAVGRYGSRVSHWQIWNEPNLPLFFGFTGDNAPRYTEILKAVYPAIKSVQPSSTVVMAGLSRMLGPDAPPAFLTTMYDAGATGYFDAAAMHPYVFPSGLAADQENGWSDVARVHDLMAAHGDGGKKIWLTEFGAPTSAPTAEGVGQEEQARQITDVLAAAAQLDYIGPAFIYSIRDVDSSATGNREANFGALFTSDWRPKAVASVLAR